MGTLLAEFVGDWYLAGAYPQLIKETVRNIDPDAQTVSGWIQQREQQVLIFERIAVKVTAFANSLGETRTQFDFKTGGGAGGVYTPAEVAGMTDWECTQDDLLLVDSVTGEARQVQVWERLTPWTIIDGSAFSATYSEGE